MVRIHETKTVMGMREIKFRAWHKERKNMTPAMKLSFLTGNEPFKLKSPPEEYEWMQYTGLKDKNGKEIYEGDVVKSKCYYVHKRWWSNISDIPVIEAECKRQEENIYQSIGRAYFADGCFYIDGIPANKISNNEIGESGRGYNGDWYSKKWAFEVIGNIYENPELIK